MYKMIKFIINIKMLVIIIKEKNYLIQDYSKIILYYLLSIVIFGNS